MADLGNVLITGGAGFIGSNLIAYLRTHDLARIIRVVDNETVGSRSALEGLDTEFYQIDIRNTEGMMPLLKGIDSVIHLAADTRVIDSIDNPRFNFENNVIGTFNILMLMAQSGIKKFINASTGGAILGSIAPPVNEQMPPRPLSPYGASKLAAEGYANAFAEIYDMKCISLRFSNVYGPRSANKGSVVAAFIRQILSGQPIAVFGDGEQTRDYIFVEDLCEGIAKALRSERSDIYQLGTGRPTSINQLIDALRAVAGAGFNVDIKYLPERVGEVKFTYCDIQKAQRELEFFPRVNLGCGLEKTWRWYLEREVIQQPRVFLN